MELESNKNCVDRILGIDLPSTKWVGISGARTEWWSKGYLMVQRICILNGNKEESKC